MKGRAGLVLTLVLLCVAGAGLGLLFWPKAAHPKTTPAPTAVVPQQASTPAPPKSEVSYDNIFPRALSARVPVIMYHDIVAERGRHSVWFDCTKAEFEEQMQWLTEQGAHPIPLDELYRHLTQGDPVPDGAVVLTFDDNYQGFYDNAYPILKQYKYPGAMFVHTNFVGDKANDHPKMDWPTLQQLDKEGLVTICSHTLSHPDDIRLLPPEEQEKEMGESKRILEEKLGHPILYFAYPNGKGGPRPLARLQGEEEPPTPRRRKADPDAPVAAEPLDLTDTMTRDIARKVGYKMAFTIDNGLAEESPDILLVNRYIHTRLKKAWEDAKSARENAPAAFVEQDIKVSPVRLEIVEYDNILKGKPLKMGLLHGGMPSSRRGLMGRISVGDFVQQAGGVAGINGTFFADARISGTGSTLIGPSQTTPDNQFMPETDEYRLTRIGNRPLVLWGPKKIAIFPFEPGTMNDEKPFHALMPDYTDLFMAGAWIVHGGVARTQAQMKAYSAGDFKDPRRRAFFGITSTGEIIAGASLYVITTMQLAQAAAAAGAQEAVLLDSGFSTSVVYDGKIIVTGHTATNIPSRPVPHSIVLMGDLQPPTDEVSLTALQTAESALAPPDSLDPDQPPPVDTPKPRHRRKRQRQEGDTKGEGGRNRSHRENPAPDTSRPDNPPQ